MAFLINATLALWTIWVFVLGAAVGSLLNVCVARLPLEKSLFWPSSHCGACLRPIRWRDNIPLLSYWILRGRCRSCGAPFSIRYFLIELGTALAFAGLFILEVVVNVHQLPFFENNRWAIRAGLIPWQAWVFFGFHAALLSLLIVAAACDLERREIPLGLTFFGAAFGLLGAVLFPWPWPNNVNDPKVMPANGALWWMPGSTIGPGLYPWPVWGPTPEWLPLGSPLSGLAAGLAGVFVGSWLLRGIRTIFTQGLGREALGLGDADLMMMVGAFLGWQPVVVAFFAGGLFSLGFAIVQAVVFRDNSLPFGPGLAAGTVATWLLWRWIGPAVQPLMFDGMLLAMVGGAGAALMLLASAFFRVTGGSRASPAG